MRFRSHHVKDLYVPVGWLGSGRGLHPEEVTVSICKLLNCSINNRRVGEDFFRDEHPLTYIYVLQILLPDDSS